MEPRSTSSEPGLAPTSRPKFGPFEVNLTTGELLKSGIRIPLPRQPSRILIMLLERAGELVTREQMREQIWTDGTFVDFEHGLNGAMNKLRRALNDSADKPRYIETVAGQGYRFVGHVELPAPAPVPLPSKSAPSMADAGNTSRAALLWAVIAAVSLTTAALLGWRLYRTSGQAPRWNVVQLTSDAGLSETPALSPDGKLVAYSSDLANGEKDLYVKQVAGGEPIRLTNDGAGNVTPGFSPDGSKIVFRSNRDGGGIYEIPALGGPTRLLGREGWQPQFSPDGSEVAYWVGAPNVATSVPGTGTVWIVPTAGGQPRRVGSNFSTARYPIWSPDGRHLLLVGYNTRTAYERLALDWWIVPTSGDGSARRSGAYKVLAKAGLEGRSSTTIAPQLPIPEIPNPGCWVGSPSRVVFSVATGDAQSLWEVGISPDGVVTGIPRRLTVGAGNEVQPSCSSTGAVAFSSAEPRIELWSLPFNLDGGKPTGTLLQLTQGPAFREHASLSGDGRDIAFASSQSGRLNVWLLNREMGIESHVASSPFIQRYPVVSASGGKIAFSSYENQKRFVQVVRPGGTPEKLCGDCLRATDWSVDEKKLLVFRGNPYEIDVLDAVSRELTPLLRHPTHHLLYGRFSPDNKWVSFTERIGPDNSRIVVAPVDGQRPIPESAWIEISREGDEDWANWSPDGKTLYFTSGRDGHMCLWAQRLDMLSRRPVQKTFAALHLHGRIAYQERGWSAAGNRIAMTLDESTGNIWIMSRSPERK